MLGLLLQKNISQSPRLLYVKFGRNWQSGSGEKDENAKVYRQTKFTGNQKSSLELLAQVSW